MSVWNGEGDREALGDQSGFEDLLEQKGKFRRSQSLGRNPAPNSKLG